MVLTPIKDINSIMYVLDDGCDLNKDITTDLDEEIISFIRFEKEFLLKAKKEFKKEENTFFAKLPYDKNYYGYCNEKIDDTIGEAKADNWKKNINLWNCDDVFAKLLAPNREILSTLDRKSKNLTETFLVNYPLFINYLNH